MGRKRWGLLVAVTLFFPGWLYAAAPYSMIDLGGLTPQGVSVAHAINDEGEITGGALNASGSLNAVVWKGGKIIDLGVSGEAFGINAQGAVCGVTYDASGTKRAFTWAEGAMVPLGLEKERSEAFGLNGSGQVVGYYRESRVKIGFSWLHGELSTHDTLSKARLSQCFGVNSRGEIAGWVRLQDRSEQAFFWDGADVMTLGDFTSGDRPKSKAVALNSKGHVVGHAMGEEGVYRPFLWDGHALADVGGEGEHRGEALGLNDSDQVVGAFWESSNRAHAFLHDGTQFLDLNDLIDPGSLWTLTHARDINNKGWIVGTADVEGVSGKHAFLLIPRGPEWTGLRGRLTSQIATTQAALKGATVWVVGTDRQATSDSRGAFIIENLPEGVYDVVFSMGGFIRKKVSGVSVSRGAFTPLTDGACTLALKTRTPDMNGDGDLTVVDTIKVLKVLSGT